MVLAGLALALLLICPGSSGAQVKATPADALEALRDLDAAVSVGVTFQEYMRRLADTKIRIDRYLRVTRDQSKVRKLIADAMDSYEFAGAAWNAKISEDWVSVADDPRSGICPEIESVISQETKKALADEKIIGEKGMRGLVITTRVPLFWRCASRKASEAAHLAK